jgi:hypothetical protein
MARRASLRGSVCGGTAGGVKLIIVFDRISVVNACTWALVYGLFVCCQGREFLLYQTTTELARYKKARGRLASCMDTLPLRKTVVLVSVIAAPFVMHRD